jgi:signal transduction histidine kinase
MYRHIEQLEAENRALKAQIDLFSEVGQALTVEKECLKAVADHFPNGALFRLRMDRVTKKISFDYVSATWEKVFGISAETTIADVNTFFNRIHPDDLSRLGLDINESAHTTCNLETEIRYRYTDNSIKWLQLTSHPYCEGYTVYFDGLMLDITNRKLIDNELVLYRDNLEQSVKEKTEEIESMNEELTAANEELETINEELQTTNDELKTTNDELALINDELSLYRSQLELMVELKTSEQSILIKVLQIMQTSENLSHAVNKSLAEIGKYFETSRVYIFEKNIEGNTISNTYEWCNTGVVPVIETLQNMPVEVAQPWFDAFDAGGIVFASDIHQLTPEIVEILSEQDIKSIAVFPLLSGDVRHGFFGLDDCMTNREWGQNELELLKSLSQILSATIHRFHAETATLLSQQTMRTVLDNIDARIFVSDFETSKILFANKKTKEKMGDIEGRPCWEVMQQGMRGPCKFCPRPRLRDNKNRPTEPYHWEFQEADKLKWYACSDVAIKWIDGRWVHLEYATNVTQLKNTETELIEAKEKAEESDRLKSAFLANMSHEIRTPLNGITGFLKFMEDDNLAPKRRREYINIVNTNLDQFIKLIDDIVDVSIIEAEQMILHPVVFRLNEFMEEMNTFFDSWLYSKGKPRTAMILDRSRFIDNCICYIDSVRLRQTINNLIDNAFKFLDKGYICFGYRQKEPGLLEFVVEDTGVGIPENEQKTIFERFRQVKSDKRLGGTGLGLTISRSLIQMMGGNIRLESTEGIGSTFYFTVSYLPVTTADEHIFDPFWKMQEDAAAPFSGKTVWLSESFDMKYMYYEKMLFAAGFSVVRTDVQQWHDPVDITGKTDVLVVSLSEYGNTEHNITGQSKTPVIYIVSEKLYDYYHLTLNNPYSMVIAEPLDFDALTQALKNIMK